MNTKDIERLLSPLTNNEKDKYNIDNTMKAKLQQYKINDHDLRTLTVKADAYRNKYSQKISNGFSENQFHNRNEPTFMEKIEQEVQQLLIKAKEAARVTYETALAGEEDKFTSIMDKEVKIPGFGATWLSLCWAKNNNPNLINNTQAEIINFNFKKVEEKAQDLYLLKTKKENLTTKKEEIIAAEKELLHAQNAQKQSLALIPKFAQKGRIIEREERLASQRKITTDKIALKYNNKTKQLPLTRLETIEYRKALRAIETKTIEESINRFLVLNKDICPYDTFLLHSNLKQIEGYYYDITYQNKLKNLEMNYEQNAIRLKQTKETNIQQWNEFDKEERKTMEILSKQLSKTELDAIRLKIRYLNMTEKPITYSSWNTNIDEKYLIFRDIKRDINNTVDIDLSSLPVLPEVIISDDLDEKQAPAANFFPKNKEVWQQHIHTINNSFLAKLPILNAKEKREKQAEAEKLAIIKAEAEAEKQNLIIARNNEKLAELKQLEAKIAAEAEKLFTRNEIAGKKIKSSNNTIKESEIELTKQHSNNTITAEITNKLKHEQGLWNKKAAEVKQEKPEDNEPPKKCKGKKIGDLKLLLK